MIGNEPYYMVWLAAAVFNWPELETTAVARPAAPATVTMTILVATWLIFIGGFARPTISAMQDLCSPRILGAGMATTNEEATLPEKLNTYTDGYLQLGIYGFVLGIAIILLAPFVKRWMHGVK